MSPNTPDTGLETLWEEIRRYMGVTPSFFRLASADPAVARGLFELAKFAYLESPLPALFKEKLFTYLSRFCGVRYCVTRHAAFLLGRGNIAGDPACPPLTPEKVMVLLSEPFPERDQLPHILSELESLTAPLKEWPDFESVTGRYVRIASAVIFLEPGRSPQWCAALRRLLGPRQFEWLMLFLAFVRTAHFWTQVHMSTDDTIPMLSDSAATEHDPVSSPSPRLVFEEDIEILFREHQALVEPLLQKAQDAVQFELGSQLRAELQELRTTHRLAQALKKSEARFRDLYENAPDMFCSIDAETGVILECNHTLLDKTGFTREEIVGKPVFERYTPASREQARLCFQQFRQHGVVQDAELQLLTREGKTIEVSLNATAVRDASGHIISSRSIWRDISKQKSLEDQQRLIFEASPNGILVVNAEGRILMANSRIEDWFGYRREELIGTPVERLVPERFRTQHAGDRREFMLVPQVRPMGKGRDLYGLCKDGSEVPLEIGLNPMGREHDGRILVTITNMTERKRDRDTIRRSTVALHEQLDLNKTITDNASTSLLMIDTSGQVTFANPATETVMGYKPEELIGKVLHQVVHHSHPDGVPYPNEECPITRILPSNDVLSNHEDMFIHKDGHFYPVRCNARQIFKQDVRVGIVIEVSDITDIKRAEKDRQLFTLELARQVNERTEELLNSQTQLRELATELNLTEQRERQRIAMELHDYLSQLLVVGRLKLGQTRQVLDGNVESLNLVKETEDVLDQALTYTRTLTAELSPSVLFEFGLLAALQWLANQMIHHGLKVEFESGGVEELKLPEEHAILLYQSTRELFLNVIKHADTGRATLTLGKEEGMLRISVRDEGKGFHPPKGTATQPFTDQAVKFGLFSIRERMITLGGTFEIESLPDHGTTARLMVPLALKLEKISTPQPDTDGQHVDQPTVDQSLPEAGDLPKTSTKNQIRILIADDHVMVREGLRKMLESHEDLELVGEAGNGKEAIDLVERLKPALVIMDVNMPQLNGIEATSRIKAHHPDIIIIGLSVNAGGENQQAMLKAGAVALLPKEAAVADLYQMITTVMTSQP
ncbi:PAS domain S-box protein [Candidatus Nitrospira neomarina]|uniref:PAS domain S-box protein n=1 Tax=Candidatus Nitrospira neomarina TaxID=3020899 RepID=A0AA96JU49_9BACT|nr:PAS domain S-box protein [Candidatus Nitrospira neomarina]WNM60192.1 PAS domain S-box protein [Candidatus Nitrospira neomarina]